MASPHLTGAQHRLVADAERAIADPASAGARLGDLCYLLRTQMEACAAEHAALFADLSARLEAAAGLRGTRRAPQRPGGSPRTSAGAGWVPGSATQVEPDATRSTWGRPPR